MSDGNGLAEALLGLDGFRVLEVVEAPDELVVTIETTVDFMGCSGCGTRAESQDRVPVAIRDLPCFGRPARLSGSSAGGDAGSGCVTSRPGPSAASSSTPRSS